MSYSVWKQSLRKMAVSYCVPHSVFLQSFNIMAFTEQPEPSACESGHCRRTGVRNACQGCLRGHLGSGH